MTDDDEKPNPAAAMDHQAECLRISLSLLGYATGGAKQCLDEHALALDLLFRQLVRDSAKDGRFDYSNPAGLSLALRVHTQYRRTVEALGRMEYRNDFENRRPDY